MEGNVKVESLGGFRGLLDVYRNNKNYHSCARWDISLPEEEALKVPHVNQPRGGRAWGGFLVCGLGLSERLLLSHCICSWQE